MWGLNPLLADGRGKHETRTSFSTPIPIIFGSEEAASISMGHKLGVHLKSGNLRGEKEVKKVGRDRRMEKVSILGRGRHGESG